jgi:hypothetical protein
MFRGFLRRFIEFEVWGGGVVGLFRVATRWIVLMPWLRGTLYAAKTQDCSHSIDALIQTELFSA